MSLDYLNDHSYDNQTNMRICPLRTQLTIYNMHMNNYIHDDQTNMRVLIL